MKYMSTIIGLVATLVMSGSVVMANPALMQKNKPGYPYPGTVAIEHFGAAALQKGAVTENNQNKLEGTVTDQTTAGVFEGKSLLPPMDDPAKISPRPELKGPIQGQQQGQDPFSTVGPRPGMQSPAPGSPSPQIQGQKSGFPDVDFPKVKGELLKIEGDYWTIRDNDGYRIRLRVDENTQKQGQFNPGDKVMAGRTIKGYAKWIRTADAATGAPGAQGGKGSLTHEEVMKEEAKAGGQDKSSARESGPEASSYTMTGEVLDIVGADYIIKDAEGNKARLHRSNDTKLFDTFNPGDKLQAEVNWASTMLSAKKVGDAGGSSGPRQGR